MIDWFWARVMATEGELSVNHSTLEAIAAETANYCKLRNIKPNYDIIADCCDSFGVDFNLLLKEEQDWLIKELIKWN